VEYACEEEDWIRMGAKRVVSLQTCALGNTGVLCSFSLLGFVVFGWTAGVNCYLVFFSPAFVLANALVVEAVAQGLLGFMRFIYTRN